MQVNFNFFQPSNNFMNVSAMNHGLATKGEPVNRANDDKNKDRVTISPQGKAMNAIKNLMEQKDNITEQKNALVAKTMENGGDMKSIEVQLDTYKTQMEEIDKQIAQITADQLKKDMEKADEKKSKDADSNKTKEELETENLSKLAGISNDIKDAQLVSSVKDKVDGAARVEASEIKLGKIAVETLQSRGQDGSVNVADMINNAKKIIEKQEAIASQLQDKITSLASDQSSLLGDAVTALNENYAANSENSSRSGDAKSSNTPEDINGETVDNKIAE